MLNKDIVLDTLNRNLVGLESGLLKNRPDIIERQQAKLEVLCDILGDELPNEYIHRIEKQIVLMSGGSMKNTSDVISMTYAILAEIESGTLNNSHDLLECQIAKLCLLCDILGEDLPKVIFARIEKQIDLM